MCVCLCVSVCVYVACVCACVCACVGVDVCVSIHVTFFPLEQTVRPSMLASVCLCLRMFVYVCLYKFVSE